MTSLHIASLSLRASLCLLTVLLSACGFTLRGYGEDSALHPDLQRLQVIASTGHDVLLPLQAGLRASGVDLIDDSEETEYRLVLDNERSQERIISLDSSARAGEYALSMTLSFHLLRGQNMVLGPEEISLEQVYVADPRSAIAKAEEAETIQREMRRDIARQIVLRLQNFAP